MDADQTPAPIPVFTSEIDEAREKAIMAGAMAGLMLGELQKKMSALLKTAQCFRQNADAWPRKFLPPDLESITFVLSAVNEIRDLMLCRQYHAPDLRPAAVSDTPSPPTFAEVVKAPPEPAEARPQQPSKPRHQPAAPRRDAAKPSRRALPSTRLIVDLSGCHPTKKPHPASLCNALNDALGGRLAVSAVSTARSGNLILHASAPACSAQALAAHRSLVSGSTISPLLGIADPAEPPMYPADSWHKVVFHRVPLMQPGALPSDRDFNREVAKRNQLPGTQYRIGNVRFLLERDKVPREEVTVRVDFIEQEDARRFLRDGIFLFGSHCRATRYKPRSSNGRRTSGGHG
ncbi:hypothetical protein R3P38DRAFT_2966497 [Favolaschia claudopus]|uniref:Uncharacterized protein n=1 Tax=Favolaschia claudopus TaxID=2862362 RepID=A0AAW0B6A2_9AGAR